MFTKKIIHKLLKKKDKKEDKYLLDNKNENEIIEQDKFINPLTGKIKINNI